LSVGIPSSTFVSDSVPFVPRRFTVEEYHRLGEIGVLTEDDRVELLEGVITPKMMHNPPHDSTIMQIEEVLRPRITTGWTIRIQSSLTTADSEPEPDLTIVRGRARDYVRRHPEAADVAMVIEVADASLLRDRAKARLYARAGMPMYWIVNLVDKQIEVHCQPLCTDETATYQQTTVYQRGNSFSVSVADLSFAVAVDDLLP